MRSGVVVTMERGDACPYLPGKRYEDWKLVDSADQGIDDARPIGNDIRACIDHLVSDLH